MLCLGSEAAVYERRWNFITSIGEEFNNVLKWDHYFLFMSVLFFVSTKRPLCTGYQQAVNSQVPYVTLLKEPSNHCKGPIMHRTTNQNSRLLAICTKSKKGLEIKLPVLQFSIQC
jgi:hypothetical protein